LILGLHTSWRNWKWSIWTSICCIFKEK